MNNIYPLPLDKGSQKLADTYKENLRLELRLVKQSPTNAETPTNKVLSATNRRFEKIEKDFGLIKNIKLDNCKVYKNDQNQKPVKIEKNNSKNMTNSQNIKYSKK